jgi:hypothetical protein
MFMASQIKNKYIKKETKMVPEYKCKRCKKSNNAWIEQILLNLKTLEKNLKELELSVIYIKDYLDIKTKEENKIG